MDGVFYLTGKPASIPTNIFSVEDWTRYADPEPLVTVGRLVSPRHDQEQDSGKAQYGPDTETGPNREMARKAIAQVRLADHVLLKGNIKTCNQRCADVQG